MPDTELERESRQAQIIAVHRLVDILNRIDSLQLMLGVMLVLLGLILWRVW